METQGCAVFDREAILAAVDLRAWADELLGPGRGSKRSPMWGCPSPGHQQTGRTPPVGVFTRRTGEPRWHCHGCGIGGSAIDLVMQVRGVSARAALEELAERTGQPEGAGVCRRRQGKEDRPKPLAAYIAPQAVPELEPYVAECAAQLWTPAGSAALRWTTGARGLPEDVLRLNRVGVDLGFGVRAGLRWSRR